MLVAELCVYELCFTKDLMKTRTYHKEAAVIWRQTPPRALNLPLTRVFVVVLFHGGVALSPPARLTRSIDLVSRTVILTIAEHTFHCGQKRKL